jgi:hypothetical protein
MTMVRVSVHGDRVRFEVEGWDKLWALRSQLEIPVAHIQAVRADPEPARGWWHGLRLPGTQIPGLLTAGSFYQSGGFVFYDVHDPENTVVIDLDHEHYERLVIEVENPEAVVATLRVPLVSASLGGMCSPTRHYGLRRTVPRCYLVRDVIGTAVFFRVH